MVKQPSGKSIAGADRIDNLDAESPVFACFPAGHQEAASISTGNADQLEAK